MEIPSILFENFIYSKQVMKLLANKPEIINDDFILMLKKNIYLYNNNVNIINVITSTIELKLYTETKHSNYYLIII